MVNRPEWIDAMFAIMKIGAVLVPVNTRFRTDDMAYILAQSDADAVLLADRSGPVDYLGMIREVVPALGSRPDPRFPCLRHVVVLADRPDHGVADWHEGLDRGTSVTAAALRDREAPGTCRACGRGSAAPACRARSPSRVGRESRSAIS